MNLSRVIQGVVFSLWIAAPLWAQPAKLSLEESFQLAKAQSEALGKTRQTIAIAQARYDQAFSALLPQITLNATQRIRNEESFGSSFSENVGPNFGSNPSTRSKRQLQTFATLTQPLFQGFRDIIIANAIKESIGAGYQSGAVDTLFGGNV